MLFSIAEDHHANIRLGATADGISYQGITKHLQFKLVFEEQFQAEGFRMAVVLPDISVEFEPIQRVSWTGDLDLVDEEDHARIERYATPFCEDDLDAYTQMSAVSLDAETKLRMLEREDSCHLFRQKPIKCHIVKPADAPECINNPNNIVYMSRVLYQYLDTINSTEGIPQFYLRYVLHSETPQQGLWNNQPVVVYQTMLDIVFKDEVAKDTLTVYFKNPTDVNQSTIRVGASFPNPREFDYFAQTTAEETLARWAAYDALRNR